MKINLSVTVSLLTLIVGFSINKPYLFIPATVLSAGLIDLLTRRWITSNKFGAAKTFSASIKLLFALVGFYAMVGQIVCIALIIYWFIP